MNIKIKSVKKNYGKKIVLKNINFEAKNGDCIGIIGRNGSGKSTLLAVLAGVIKPDEGSFMIDDKDIFSDVSLRHQKVAYVPQGTPLIEELSALDNLKMWYKNDKLKESLESGFLNLLGINEFLNVKVNKMSGGMKKRLSIGCAINNNPSVLLLDEPTAALDIVCREAIYAYYKAFREKGGILILVTHEIGEIAMCSDCFMLKDGSLEPYTYDADIAGLINRI